MRRAHTLMEMLVVLSLLSLAAGIVVPRFLSGWDSAQLSAAASAVRNDFAFAKARAASTGLRHLVVIDANTGELQVQPFRPEELTQTTAAPVDQSEPVLQDTVPERVKVTEWRVEPFGYLDGSAANQQDVDVLTFYPEGRSDNALLVLESAGGQQRGVEVDGYTGEVRELNAQEIQDWHGRPAGGH
jgi:Tfp pilus assembly protein FimT